MNNRVTLLPILSLELFAASQGPYFEKTYLDCVEHVSPEERINAQGIAKVIAERILRQTVSGLPTVTKKSVLRDALEALTEAEIRTLLNAMIRELEHEDQFLRKVRREAVNGVFRIDYEWYEHVAVRSGSRFDRRAAVCLAVATCLCL